MPNKHTDFIIQGMFRDTSEHAFDSKFAYENQNLRITAEPNSDSEHTGNMYALTNEKGNKYTPIIGLENQDMDGIPIGQCTLNNQWVVFYTSNPEIVEFSEEAVENSVSSGNNVYLVGEEGQLDNLVKKSKDKIYRLWMNDGKTYGELLYQGNLGFDYTHPLETIGYYENESIQKVYWTDGLNQPRFINIVEKDEKKARWNDYSFDFVPVMDLLNHKVTITENQTGGKFPAGMIQWHFTYSRQFGQETAIFESTKLYELKFNDRGAAPDEQTSQSFEIKLTGLDTSFDFVNIYSTIRTSLDNVPIAKCVATLQITSDEILFVDTNLYGYAIDPQELLYKGGEIITAYTMENKDNTLFLGNYSLKRSVIPQYIKDELREYATGADLLKSQNCIDDYNSLMENGLVEPASGSVLKFENKELEWDHCNRKGTPYFKKGNTYRFGIQFQHVTGKWSEVAWVGDYICDKNGQYYSGSGGFSPTVAILNINDNIKHIVEELVNLGYVKARPVVVYPSIKERKFVAQGLLGNTVFFSKDDAKLYPDYFFRFASTNREPRKLGDNTTLCDRNWVGKECIYYLLHGDDTSDIFRDEYTIDKYSKEEDDNILNYNSNVFSFYSPDIQFDDSLILTISPEYYISERYRITQSSCRKLQTEVLTSSISNTELITADWRSGSHYTAFENDRVQEEINIKWGQSDSNSYYLREGEHGPWDTHWRTVYTENDDTNEWEKTYFSNPYIYHLYARRTGQIDTENTEYLKTEVVTYKRMLCDINSRSIDYNEHYVGGFIWEDDLFNYRTVHSDILDKDVPSKSAGFIRKYYKFTYPITLWQASGSICFDFNEKPSSVLKSNKTLQYHGAGVLQPVENSQIKVSAKASIGSETIKINDRTNILYSSRMDSVLLYKTKVYAIPTLQSSLDVNRNIKNRVKYSEYIFTAGDELQYGQVPALGIYDSALPYHSDTSYSIADSFPHWPGASHKFEEFMWHMPEMKDKSFSRSADIKYISTPHIVLSFESSNDVYYYFNSNTSFKQFIPLVDLEQDVEYNNIFGGHTDRVLQTNNFLPCGDSVDIAKKENGTYIPTPNKIEWSVGDVNTGEYEILKTYPTSFENENCVTEVMSVMIESYWNMNCRYDTWKGNPTFATSPANWNLMNPIYNQKNNFFVYHGLDLSTNSINNFPNSFTWTLTKWAGDTTDKWTHITIASNMDVDGGKGEITKLIKLQDNLLCFQPRGMSQILYNEREQIATGSGLPIELANSGKVSGVRYITERTGCNNKWSICKNESGLYWIDDENKAIMAWNQQLANLSDTLGFHSWINEKSSLSVWNPVDFNSFVTYYDPYNNNIMFFYKENMLSYNTQLNCFDSFFSYGSVPYYNAYNGTAFTLSNKDSDGNDTYRVWEQHKGDYNYFYVHENCVYDGNELILKGKYDKDGKPTDYGYEPYWTILLVNPDMPYDKVFDNIDMRTDMWNPSKELLEETFSHLEVWNEFQWNKSLLIRQVDVPKIHMPDQHSILKKKFRVWYVNIPRDIKNKGTRYYNRDRMRNTWLYVKLSKELVDNDIMIEYPYISNNKHIIHHIGVNYFI